MKTTASLNFAALQKSALHSAVCLRATALNVAALAAAEGRVATTREQDSPAALSLAADRYEVLATKLEGARALTREDLEHALIAASLAQRRAARSAQRGRAAVLDDVVDTLTALLADEALVHDEY